MVHTIKNDIIASQAWLNFCAHEQMTADQQERFATYLDLLCTWNAKFNITAIRDPEAMITDHFQDSLQLRHVRALEKQRGIADIGSGGGFPGLPLKICYPEVPFVLIEVNNKKIQFLRTVIEVLELQNVEIYSLDWRTFLRKSTYSLDLFLARASLQPEELVRVLNSDSPYADATLVYWASQAWQPSSSVAPLIDKQEGYVVGSKQRKLVFFTSKEGVYSALPRV